MAYTYSKIASVTVGSGGVSSIAFLAIPQNYTDLKLVYSLRNSRASVVSDSVVISFNNANVGSARTLRGDGASATSFTDTVMSGGRIPAATATANTFGNNEIYIPNYTSGNYKSFAADTVTETNGTTAYAELVANLYSSTNPITSISIAPGTANGFVQYSTATLYGIKAEV